MSEAGEPVKNNQDIVREILRPGLAPVNGAPPVVDLTPDDTKALEERARNGAQHLRKLWFRKHAAAGVPLHYPEPPDDGEADTPFVVGK